MNISERIRVLRKEYLHITQEALGEPLGLSRANIANIEAGRIAVTDRVISSICREFDVSEKWIRVGEGEPFDQLSEQETLLKYTALLMKDKDSTIATAIQTLIITYEQLDDVSKATLEKIALQYIDNLKKSQ